MEHFSLIKSAFANGKLLSENFQDVLVMNIITTTTIANKRWLRYFGQANESLCNTRSLWHCWKLNPSLMSPILVPQLQDHASFPDILLSLHSWRSCCYVYSGVQIWVGNFRVDLRKEFYRCTIQDDVKYISDVPNQENKIDYIISINSVAYWSYQTPSYLPKCVWPIGK